MLDRSLKNNTAQRGVNTFCFNSIVAREPSRARRGYCLSYSSALPRQRPMRLPKFIRPGPNLVNVLARTNFMLSAIADF
jgi:hypothetical protein